MNSLFAAGELQPRSAGAVTCLGQTFDNDDERRKHYLELLREKLKDPEFRKVEGFPDGLDEDILALSDPPYYTACPNPWLNNFIKCYGKQYDPSTKYNRKSLALDANEGKSHPIYKAHSYHTKVPHYAIVPPILHYTEPGDIILDGFSGSGMAGIAAQCCETNDPKFIGRIESLFRQQGLSTPQWGMRRAILSDLSTVATFIAANYNIPFDVSAFAQAGYSLLNSVEKEIGWMYETIHSNGNIGKIDYTVWTEVFTCPDCMQEIVFMEEALDEDTKKIKLTFPCPHCGSELTKGKLIKVYETIFDTITGKTLQIPKRKPSLIVYSINGSRYEKIPDENDLSIIKQIEALPLPPEVPTQEIPPMHMTHERARMDKQGITHVHHFFLPRAAYALGILWKHANANADIRIKHMLQFFVEQSIWTASKLNRYRPTGYSQVNQYMTGVYYIASQHAECSPGYILEGKLDRLIDTFSSNQTLENSVFINLGTAAHLPIDDNTVDYIFTDPPFGENIYYADLNFLIESWYRVKTNAAPEAIVDRLKKKTLADYQKLMQKCFGEYCRVLKPGRWMTVVFHNSRNSVWNAIQEALQEAGFVVAEVRTLDKQQGSYRQVTSSAVKQDLVISAYKPNGGLEERFRLTAGTEDGAWDFVRTHLTQLAPFSMTGGRSEVIAERQNHRLYDRMVAFHVQRNVRTPPLSAAEFNLKLPQYFDERDGMYFLPEQAAEYDRKSKMYGKAEQLVMFVTDESTARQWLQQQLSKKPQTFQELHPQFLKEIAGWQKHEEMLELSDLLKQYFLCYDDKGDVPSQIHSYLSSNYKELRNLPKDAPELKVKAKDRWYVPDPNKESDLEKIREKRLLREFDAYRTSTKRLKTYRGEAMRAGFKKAWQEHDYDTIIIMANKIPETALQEDKHLLMWYSMAKTRRGDDA